MSSAVSLGREFEWKLGGVHAECELGDGPPEWLIDAGEDMVTFGGSDD